MPDALTLPPLTMPQAQSVSSAEGGSVAAVTGISIDSAEFETSFADLLKAKFLVQDEDPATDFESLLAAQDPALFAGLPGIPLPLALPSAPRLLAQLKGDRSAQLPPGVASLPAISTGSPAAGATAGASAAVSPLPRPESDAVTIEPTEPASFVLALAAPQGLALSAPQTLPPAATVGVPPAPTLAPIKAPLTNPSDTLATGRPEEGNSKVDTGLPPLQAPLAASTAVSAETGQALVEMSAPDATAEFRPMLDRVIDVPGNPATQAASAGTAQTQQAPVAAVQIRLPTPFSQPGWAREVDQTLTWMVTNTRQQADLILNPPDLGRIEVTLVVKGDEVNASFASPHQAVREAIEESLVRLRESLAESGINLGQTHVGRDSSRDAPFAAPKNEFRVTDERRHEAGAARKREGAWAPSPGRGMIDVFA